MAKKKPTKKKTKKRDWQILCGDCVKGMGKLPDQSVDLAFADPPFNIKYRYDVYDDAKSVAEYIEWAQEWIDGIWRVLKPDGAFWLAIGDELAAELKMVCQTRHEGTLASGRTFIRSPFHARAWVIWYYTFGAACTKNFARSHTHLLYFTKHRSKFTFNVDPSCRVPSARQLVYGDKRANPDGKLPDNVWVLSPVNLSKAFTKTEDTWLASRVCGTFHERVSRGTYQVERGVPQMPLEIMERIVRTTSKPDELVLDPFGGTFSTGEAALRLGRKFIGFEISKEYCRIGGWRLAKV